MSKKKPRTEERGFLKHPLFVGLTVVVVGALLTYALKSSSTSPSTINQNGGNSNTINVGGNNSGQIAGGNIYNGPVIDNEVSQPISTSWQPPSLPDGCRLVSVTAAGGTVQNPSNWEQWRVVGTTLQEGGVLILPGSNVHMTARVVSNKFFVDADITLDAVHNYSISNMTFIGTAPSGWDRNSNSNAFEIVGPDGLPVFQEIYLLPEHIALNGIFPKKPGIIIGMFGGHLVSGAPDEVLTNLPNRKPIFKYPSWKYQGVLAD